MMKSAPNFLRRLLAPMLTLAPKYYCAEFTVQPSIEHLGQMMMRQHRRLYLNRAVLNQNKDIIHAELRKPTDGIFEMKKQAKCAGVVQLLGGSIDTEIDIVVDAKKMRGLAKSYNFPLSEVYVRVAGKQYRCIFYKMQAHSDGFIEKVFLKEYVTGQPNELSIPVQPTNVVNNPYLMERGEFQQKVENVNVICYNEEFPLRFYVDIAYASPDRPYRIGDLANILMPGILLSPKLNMNDKIFKINEELKRAKSQREQAINDLINKNKKKAQIKPAQGTTAASGAGGAAKDATKDAAKDAPKQAAGKDKGKK